MTTKELSNILGNTDRTVQRWCKKALKEGKNTIDTAEGVYYLSKTDEGYSLVESTDITKPRKTVSKEMSFAHLAELDGFDVLATKHTKEEKLLLVTFMRKYNYTMKIIIKSLLMTAGVLADDKKVAALNRKFLRWQKDFVEGGASALEDKRGKTRADFTKIDEDLLITAIEGAGAQGIRENYYGIHNFYCFLWQQKHSTVFTAKNEEIISYTAMVNGIKKVFKKHALVRAFWDKGHDGLLQAYPVGIKDITYTNQEWQVDATKFDFMCHYMGKDGEMKIGRLNLTAAIDVYSGNAVATLSETITSYDQVRVLHKAFERMGMPEQVYTDNGKDYVSYHYSDVLFDIGITQITAEVGQGRQKGKIERFFGVMQTEMAKMAGYIGNNVAKRTKIEDQENTKIARRTGKATRINPERLLTMEELQIMVDNFTARASESYKAQATHLMSEHELENVRRKLGKKHQRPLHRDGLKVNGFTYVSSALWTGGLATGNVVDVFEDIDDINTVYVYSDKKYIGVAMNRELGAEIMSLEEFKEAKKADRKNNIAPVQKSVRAAKELYEAYQDHNAKELLEFTPEYAKPKPKEKKEKPVVNNDFRDFVLAQEA